jgi:hypothetical protein
LRHAALRVGPAILAVGVEGEGPGRAGIAAEQARGIQARAFAARAPAHRRRAVQAQPQARALWRQCRDRHVHAREVAAGHQRRHGTGPGPGRGEVGGMARTRQVLAGEGERAVVGVGTQCRHVQRAGIERRGECRVADHQQRGHVAAHLERLDARILEGHAERQVERGQQTGPLRQLERSVARGQAQHGVIEAQLFDGDAPGQQRARGHAQREHARIEAHLAGRDVGAAVLHRQAQMHVLQAQAAGQGATRARPGELAARRQARGEPDERAVASAGAVQQPGRQRQHRHQQQRRHREQRTQPAPAWAPWRGRRRTVGVRAHSGEPRLRYSCTGASGWSRPWARSSRSGPTGERQRTPMPMPVRNVGVRPS